ncbi:MAG TPA: outer membrane protein transport protein [Polyangiales bacterium]|nr:outer membrane protein transport protein [Polyangiales bacterium]
MYERTRHDVAWLVTLWTAALVALSFSLSHSHAAASGIPGARFGYEQGSVVLANPTALAYNPGALAFSGTQLFLDVSLAVRQFSWTHPRGLGDAPEPAGFEGANYGTAKALTVGAGPQMAASFQLGKLVLGAGYYVPYGGGTLSFDRNERFANTMYPGAADGVSRWHGYDGASTVLFGVLGAAIRIGPLGIGAVGNIIYSSYSISRAQNSPIDGNDLTQEQRVYLDADTINGSFGLGVLYEAMAEQLWLAFSYQAQPGLGSMAFEGRYTLDPTIGVDGPTRVQDVTLHQALPDVFRLGARWRPSPELELRFTAEHTRWSLSQTQCLGLRDKPCLVKRDGGAAANSGVIRVLRRHWNDALAVRAGVSYWVLPELELFAGLGYENAAVPDSTLEPLVADSDVVSGALGARFRIGQTWFIAASYNHLEYLTRDNIGRSELAAPNIQTTSRSVDGGGIYKQRWGVINANLAKTF